MDLDCETRTAAADDEDDAFSDAEHDYSVNKHFKRQKTTLSSRQHGPTSSIAQDPAAVARQAKAMARNRANLFGDISRVNRFEDIARLSEYNRGLSNRNNTIARLSGE